MMILVTGGAGFIGSHVVDALVAAGHDVRLLDLEAPQRADVEVVTGDIRDPAVVARALRGVDAVSHQAARVGLERGPEDLAGYVSHNDVGTAVLLSRWRGPLVLASSMVVYGEGRYCCPEHGLVRPGPRREADLAAGRFDPACPACGRPLEPRPVPEDATVDPRNVYAATKLHQEHLAFAVGRQTGMPVTALRYHNVYGPRMPRNTPYAGVAALFAGALAAGQSPQVFEDGRQRRDLVHVRDVARANVLALGRSGDGVFNVCSGTPRTVADLAAALADAAPGAAPAVQITGRYRLGDVRHVFADPSLARSELGFEAQEDFRAGIAELWSSLSDAVVA